MYSVGVSLCNQARYTLRRSTGLSAEMNRVGVESGNEAVVDPVNVRFVASAISSVALLEPSPMVRIGREELAMDCRSRRSGSPVVAAMA